MTPKEKALDLKEKMNVIHYVKLGGKSEKSKGLTVSMHKDQIVQCALNCVDEIIKAKQEDSSYCDEDGEWHNFMDFWQEVKKEIEKL